MPHLDMADRDVIEESAGEESEEETEIVLPPLQSPSDKKDKKGIISRGKVMTKSFGRTKSPPPGYSKKHKSPAIKLGTVTLQVGDVPPPP